MKKRLGLLLAVSAMALGLGGAFAMSTVNGGVNKVEEASAESTMKHFFIDTHNVDGWDSESLCLHTWNGSKDVYTEATRVADNYWYVVIDTAGCSGYRWYRCEPGNTGTRWNESGWHTGMSDNYCTINGWDSNASFSGSTTACEETYELASTSPSTSTKRIWVDPKQNFYDSNARAGLRVFNGTAHYKTFVLGGSSQYETVAGQTLFYVDIPVSYDCQLVRLHNAFDFIWTYGGNFSAISGYNTAKVVYSWNAAAEYSAGNEETATVDYAKAVLDGYSTCLSSGDNGYGNFNNIKTCVLDKLSDADLSALRSSTFSAPGYGTRTYGDKIDLMASAAPSSRIVMFPFAMEAGNEGQLFTIIASVMVMAIAIGGYFLLRKKRI